MKEFILRLFPTRSDSQIALLDLLPFLSILMNILKIHSGAGLSSNYILFSVISSFLSVSYNILNVTFLVKFIVVTGIFILVRFKFVLKAKSFMDNKFTFLLLVLALALSALTFIDNDFTQFLKILSYYLNSFGLVCQVLLTKRTKRITIFTGFFAIFFICKAFVIIVLIMDAFTYNGTLMWNLWVNAMITLFFSIDLLYFVYYAKFKNDDYELPFTQFNDF